MSLKFVLMLILLVSFYSQSETANISENEVIVGNKRTIIETYKSKKLSKNPILLITLHGDSYKRKPSYHYRFAQIIAQLSNNVISIGMLRPGYTDDFNRKSDGIRGESVGDNYDNIRCLQLADAIEKLKLTYKSKTVILAGHSGGSAITAKIIGLRPDLITDAFIVSIPSNINSWRADKYKQRKHRVWKGDLAVVSPMDLIDNISLKTNISIFIGKDDKTTKPYLSIDYHKALEKAGKSSELKIIEGKHNIFKYEQVIDAVLTTIKNYNLTQ